MHRVSVTRAVVLACLLGLGFVSSAAAQVCSGDPTNLLYPLDGTYQLVDFCGDGATGSGPAVCPDQHNDDDSATVPLPFTFDLYGQFFTSVFVNTNGNLSFGQLFSTFDRQNFPVMSFPMVAPFWADVDTGNAANPLGDVWMKLLDSNGDAVDDTLVVTWDNVGYFNEQSDLRNTFQVAISDGSNPVIGLGNTVCFSYDEMCWTTGGASGGTGGFGGVAATAGANEGDGVSFFQIGRFDQTGSAYDGPGGANDGVDYLDNQIFCFSTATTLSNVAPIATSTGSGEIIVNAADPSTSLDTTISFISPELLQTTTTVVTDFDGAVAAGLVVTNTPGNMSDVRLEWSPACGAVGEYELDLVATDNFNPSASTTVSILIRVVCEDACGWLGDFSALGSDASVRALAEYDNGAGAALYAGGDFGSVGGVSASRVARWDGATWTALGSGADATVRALLSFDDGGGNALYAAGDFGTIDGTAAAGVARWNGSSWSAVGAGLPGGARALGIYDDGTGASLYAGGDFNLGSGAVSDYVARWDGSAWVAVGTGLDGPAHSLVSFDSGGGAELYVGGAFSNAGGSPASHLASWNGTSWTAAGAGTDGPIHALETFDAGSGTTLIVAGSFATAGASAASHVASWNGTAWSALGAGVNAPARALAKFPSAMSPDLYVGGSFSTAGSVTAPAVARWNGSSWTSVGAGANAGLFETPEVLALLDLEATSSRGLILGGTFDGAGGFGDLSANVARWTDLDPEILGAPVGDSICEGDPITLSVSVEGNAPLAYQWRKDGVDLPGETASSLTLASAVLADAGSYDVEVSNFCGAVTSTPVDLLVEAEPAVLSAPSALQVCVGAGASFSVVADGLPPITYQWRLNGANLPGATSDTYSLGAVSIADAGDYDVLVTDACSTVATSAATLTVFTPPGITIQPSPQDVCENDPVTFSVTATGTPAPTYQWRKDGANLPGETGASLTIAAVTPADLGGYDVIVANSCDTTTSASALLGLLDPPAITMNPSGASPCPGADVLLQAAATGSAPLTYEWRKNGVPVPGANSNSLLLTNVEASDTGSYNVVVTNSCGSDTSFAAAVIVLAPPVISVQPTPESLCLGTSTTLSITATGTPTRVYQWRRDGIAVPGGTGPSLVLSSVELADGGSYDVVVTNSCGQVTSDSALITILEPPVFALQPASASPCPGDNVLLQATVTGAAPISYQWFKDGSPIPGETSDALSLISVDASATGDYQLVATNGCDTTPSTTVQVGVLEGPTISMQPSSESLCFGTSTALMVLATGSPAPTYQWRKDGTDLAGATGSTLALTNVALADGGDYDVVITNSCGDVTSSPAVITILEAPSVIQAPADVTVCEGMPASLSVDIDGSMPLSFQWRLNGVDIPGEDADSLDLFTTSLADAGAYEVVVSNSCGTIVTAAGVLTVDVAPTLVTQPMSDSDCESGTVTLTVSATGTAPLSYQWRQDGVPLAGADQSTLVLSSLQTSDAGNYDVIVTNGCGSLASSVATIDVLVVPTIVTAPQAVAACQGTSTMFSVVAAGTTPLSYQWRLNGLDIPGANASNFTVASVDASSVGAYDVLVSNLCGSTLSGAATLTELVGPTLTLEPVGQTRTVGQSVVLTGSAVGTPPLSFQWLKDGSPLAGATSDTLTIDPVLLADAGSYQLEVTNACAVTTSMAAVLEVLEIPVVSDLTCCAEDATVELCWTNNFSYTAINIYRDGVSIASLPGSASCYSDLTPGSGSYGYEIAGVSGSEESMLVSCQETVFDAPSALTCTVQNPTFLLPDVQLAWTLPTAYDSVRIYRDGLLIDTVPGTDVSYLDFDVAPGSYSYEVEGILGDIDCDGTSGALCSVTFDAQGLFRRGDSNNDGGFDIADAVFTISYLFAGGAAPACFDAADANDDGNLDISDPVYLTQYFFVNGPTPPAPFAMTGEDPTDDFLGCVSSIWEMP